MKNWSPKKVKSWRINKSFYQSFLWKSKQKRFTNRKTFSGHLKVFMLLLNCCFCSLQFFNCFSMWSCRFAEISIKIWACFKRRSRKHVKNTISKKFLSVFFKFSFQTFEFVMKMITNFNSFFSLTSFERIN